VLAASAFSVVWAHTSNWSFVTTAPLLYIAPCQMPQSSSQRTTNEPSWYGVVKATLS